MLRPRTSPLTISLCVWVMAARAAQPKQHKTASMVGPRAAMADMAEILRWWLETNLILLAPLTFIRVEAAMAAKLLPMAGLARTFARAETVAIHQPLAAEAAIIKNCLLSPAL